MRSLSIVLFLSAALCLLLWPGTVVAPPPRRTGNLYTKEPKPGVLKTPEVLARPEGLARPEVLARPQVPPRRQRTHPQPQPQDGPGTSPQRPLPDRRPRTPQNQQNPRPGTSRQSSHVPDYRFVPLPPLPDQASNSRPNQGAQQNPRPGTSQQGNAGPGASNREPGPSNPRPGASTGASSHEPDYRLIPLPELPNQASNSLPNQGVPREPTIPEKTERPGFRSLGGKMATKITRPIHKIADRVWEPTDS